MMNKEQDTSETIKNRQDSLSPLADFALIRLLGYSIVAGLVIVIYVLIITKVEQSRKKIDPVEKAVVYAAEELTKVVVANPRFGLIGLCDTKLYDTSSYALEPAPVRSINSINASMRSLAYLVKELDTKSTKNLLEDDLAILDSLKEELFAKLEERISKESADKKEAVYQKTFEELKKSLPSNTVIVELKITMGGYGKSSGRATSIAALEEDKGQPFVERGFYKENLAVPVTDNHHITFFQTYDSIKNVPTESFILKSGGMLPGAVLLEVTLKNKYQNFLEHKKACALIGTAVETGTPSCLSLRFPQGMPKSIDCLKKLLKGDLWLGQGAWRQATHGAVPGDGHLTSTIDPVLTSMSANQAISVGIYNWIKSISPPPPPSQLVSMLKAEFNRTSSNNNKHPTTDPTRLVNSCLSTETGARERAFLKATMPGNIGQKALANCFEYPDNSLEFPNSALPVVINNRGEALIPGRSDFNKELINGYLDSIYSTNLAALETMATTRLISKKYHAKITNNQSKGVPVDDKDIRVLNLARLAGGNALKIAEKTFEISSRNFTLCRNGLHHIDKPVNAYLLSRQFVFIPVDKPLTEADLIAVVTTKEENQNNKKTGWHASPWLSKNSSILLPWRDYFKTTAGIKVDGKPLDLVLAEKLFPAVTGPVTIIFDSRDLQTGADVIPHTSEVYPFKAQPIFEGQSVYYCANALNTGEDPIVNWSLLLKDNSFHKSTDKNGSRYLYRNHLWCKEFDPPFSTSPQLSVEIQLRRPIPVLENIPHSTLVTDPRFDHKLPIVPPIPAQMM